jgi:BASS family bile acid:Na+ symporter
LIEPGSNSGPAFAAVAIAFNNDPEILGAMTVLIFLQIVVAAPIASWIGKDQPDEGEGGEETVGEDSPAEASTEAAP